MSTLDRIKLLAARYRAATDRPYLAAALYALAIVESEHVPTIAVDTHWRCYVSAEFVDATPVPELAGAWIHEVSHLLRDHHGRTAQLPQHERRNHHRVNIAQDCEINDDLLSDGLLLPVGHITPQTFDLPNGQLFEQYLPQLPDDPLLEHSPGGVGYDCGSGAHGTPSDWEISHAHPGGARGVSPVEADALRRATAEAIRAHLRARGTVPAGWRRWAEQILEPVVDWRQVLTGAVREAVAWAVGAADYTYRRPSRRTPALRGVVLPSLRRPLPHVAVVIDTSGSMNTDDLASALAEVTGVLRAIGVGHNRLTVLACDADVHTNTRITSIAQVTLAGGGGTDMRVGIVTALAAPQRPHVIIVLTDGHTPWPSQPAGCRLIAGLIGDTPPTPPPWAEPVHIRPRHGAAAQTRPRGAQSKPIAWSSTRKVRLRGVSSG